MPNASNNFSSMWKMFERLSSAVASKELIRNSLNAIIDIIQFKISTTISIGIFF